MFYIIMTLLVVQLTGRANSLACGFVPRYVAHKWPPHVSSQLNIMWHHTAKYISWSKRWQPIGRQTPPSRWPSAQFESVHQECKDLRNSRPHTAGKKSFKGGWNCSMAKHGGRAWAAKIQPPPSPFPNETLYTTYLQSLRSHCHCRCTPLYLDMLSTGAESSESTNLTLRNFFTGEPLGEPGDYDIIQYCISTHHWAMATASDMFQHCSSLKQRNSSLCCGKSSWRSFNSHGSAFSTVLFLLPIQVPCARPWIVIPPN